MSVRQYADRIECWLGGNRVLECPRATRRDGRHPRQIDYRHLIDGLKRKPGAFARWVLRDDAFPRIVYRTTWEALVTKRPEREACRTMVALLALAADGHEAELAIELEALRASNELPDLDAINRRFSKRRSVLPALEVPLPHPGVYDGLLGQTP